MPTKFFLALEKILGKWILQELPTWTSARWEATLQDQVTLLLEESQERSVPAWPAAAVHWLAPNVGRPKMAVSLVIAAFLRGWMTQRPSIARPPPSYTIMMLIALWLGTHGRASHDTLGDSLSSLNVQYTLGDSLSPLNVQLRNAWRCNRSLQNYQMFFSLAEELGRLEARTRPAANQAADTLSRSSELFFERLFGEFKADTASSSNSSQARVASVRPYAAGGEPASSSTSAAARTSTSPTRR